MSRKLFPTETPSKVPYALCCAYFGGLDEDHAGGVRALEFGSPEVKVFRTHGVPYIDQARAILAAAAMAHLPDEAVLVSLDHDIVFHPVSIPLLVEACAMGPYDVLAVPYSMRKEGARHGQVDRQAVRSEVLRVGRVLRRIRVRDGFYRHSHARLPRAGQDDAARAVRQ